APEQRIDDAVLAPRHESFALAGGERDAERGSAFFVAGRSERRIVVEHLFHLMQVLGADGGKEHFGGGEQKCGGHVCLLVRSASGSRSAAHRPEEHPRAWSFRPIRAPRPRAYARARDPGASAIAVDRRARRLAGGGGA